MVIHEYSLVTFTLHGNYITYELVTMCALWETSCMLTYIFVAARSDDVSNPYLRPLPQVDKARPEECDSTLRFTNRLCQLGRSSPSVIALGNLVA